MYGARHNFLNSKTNVLPCPTWRSTFLWKKADGSVQSIVFYNDLPTKTMKSEVYTTTLSTFKFLTTLKVVIELCGDAADFWVLPEEENGRGVSDPPFDDKLGREAALRLWRSFFLNDPFAWLTNLTVCFTRLQPYDRIDTVELEYPIRIKRHERDDASSPLDDGFTVDSPGKWRDRIWEDYAAGWA